MPLDRLLVVLLAIALVVLVWPHRALVDTPDRCGRPRAPRPTPSSRHRDNRSGHAVELQ